MVTSVKIREQIISSFKTEVAEHIQTLNDGILAIEKGLDDREKRKETLDNVFRAAHSLKGAARAIGVSAIEQLAHALEDILGAMQREAVTLSPGLFSACYQAIDAVGMVLAAYDAGETAPPIQVLQALSGLEPYRHAKPETPSPKIDQSSPNSRQANTPPDPHPASPRNGSRKIDDIITGFKNMLETADPETAPRFSSVQSPETAEPESQARVQTSSAVPLSPNDETIRVNVGKLDALMAQLSELLVSKIHAEQRLAQVRQVKNFMARWQKEWLAVRSDYSRLSRLNASEDGEQWNRQTVRLSRMLDYMESQQDHLREVNALAGNLLQEYSSDTMQLSLVIDGVEEEVKRVRMLPLSTITGSFSRMVRDLAQASGKNVSLVLEGGTIELDKRVLEQIKDPLIHLLRNAADHGIEKPEVRLAAGKPTNGLITLSAAQSGKEVTISVSDDGAGLDLDAIRQTALHRGMSNVQSMTDAEIVDLIYNPGFSTHPIITDLSGRGVGLDIVRRNVETLRGRINLEWTAGKGACFTLMLPLTLTSTRGLMVKAGGELFAIPLNSIERIEYLPVEEVISVGGHDTIQYNNRPLMLTHLAHVLGLSRSHERADARVPVVILSAAERRMAFAVDELADELELVIKGFGKQLTRVGGIAGATVTGSGDVLLIVNVPDLMKLALRDGQSSLHERSVDGETAQSAAAPDQQRILVVDDSITTRTLEKNILEAAGYSVQLATDGLEAINVVFAGELPDLIISDIAMPRMDGFALAKRIKGDERTANLPLILVTSLDSPEDKAHGIEVGADAYIVKSNFDQNNLLDTIEQLI